MRAGNWNGLRGSLFLGKTLEFAALASECLMLSRLGGSVDCSSLPPPLGTLRRFMRLLPLSLVPPGKTSDVFSLPICSLLFVVFFASTSAFGAEENQPLLGDAERVEGMVLIPGGTFSMGGDPGLMDGGSQSHGTSYPVHKVTLDSFWMDETEVTNAQFAEFVEATGYVTFAEQPLSEAFVKEMKQAAATSITELERLAAQSSGRRREEFLHKIKRIKEASDFGESAGAIVFRLPGSELFSEFDYTQWWRIIPGATWRQPEGPGSTWVGRENHPVINIAPRDAAAYASWAGKRLPTEAEWERAARGGLVRKPYVWGKEFAPQGESVWMANIWQGVWPYENTGEDGFVGTAPVKRYPPNAYGLYDMAGNVWEIVADRYYSGTYQLREGKEVINPLGPSESFLKQIGQRLPSFVTRGGSFLCSDSWCRGYQPGSRQSLEADSPANHTGFRCARDVD